MRSRPLHYVLSAALLLAGCRTVDRSEYDTFHNDLVNWRNRVDNRLGEAERRQTDLEARISAAEARADTVRMGILTQLQNVQRQTARGLDDAAAATERQDQMLLELLGTEHGYSSGQVDRLDGRLAGADRRLATLEGRERGLPADIATVTSIGGRNAYIAVVRDLAGVMDYRKFVTPEAYITEADLQRAVNRSILPIDTIYRLAEGAPHLAQFPAPGNDAQIHATIPYHQPLGSPENARQTLRHLALEGMVHYLDGTVVPVGRVDTLLNDPFAIFLGARRPEEIVVPTTR